MYVSWRIRIPPSPPEFPYIVLTTRLLLGTHYRGFQSLPTDLNVFCWPTAGLNWPGIVFGLPVIRQQRSRMGFLPRRPSWWATACAPPTAPAAQLKLFRDRSIHRLAT